MKQRIHEILASTVYINIATCNDNQPWNTAVYAVHDDNLSFYWKSWINAVHSKNICLNPEVFITIYDSTRALGTNHQRCIYLKGKAYQIEDMSEVTEINLLFPEDRRENNPENFTGNKVKRFYKFIPEQMWLNDVSEREVTNETIKMRIELPLNQ